MAQGLWKLDAAGLEVAPGIAEGDQRCDPLGSQELLGAPRFTGLGFRDPAWSDDKTAVKDVLLHLPGNDLDERLLRRPKSLNL